jgi:nucleotide-binding universal stress UspA family protein
MSVNDAPAMDLSLPTATASLSRSEPMSGPIDTARGEDSPPTPRRVLVATDASATSAGAERAGVEIAAQVGASLVFVSVIDPARLRLPGGLFHTRVDQVRSQREAALARLVATARELGVAAQFLIWEGDPGSSVIDAADAEGADVIVVGSHNRGPIGRRLLGSVSSYVVGHARGPVVIIRPDQGLADVWPVPLDGSPTD